MAKRKGGGYGRLSIPSTQARKQRLMNAYEMYGADKAKEQDGIWLDFGDFSFKVARAGGSNIEFAKTMEEISRPYRRAMEQNVLDPKVAEKLLREAYAKSVVRDWKGMTDIDGNPLEFSQENVIKVFEDLPDLFFSVQRECEKFANFKKAEVKAETKNS